MVSTPTISPGSWFRRGGKAVNPRMRLVCFPHAGGAASFFNPWSSLLPAHMELLSVQYPGRQDRIAEPCLERMEELSAGITTALSRLLDRPIVMFGHSMGATVAFEVALQLEKIFSFTPVTLFVSGQQAPHIPSKEEAPGDDEAMIAEIRGFGDGSAAALDDPDLLELAMPSIRADFRLIHNYRTQPVRAISAPITSYVGDKDPDVSTEKAQAWGRATRGKFHFESFPGGHFYLSDNGPELVSKIVDHTDAH